MKLRLIFPLITGFIIVVLSGFSLLSSTGMWNATNSPIDGRNCYDCHSPIGTAVPTVSITAVPSFGAGNTYSAGTSYTINVNCSGGFVKYGFDIELLNSTSPVSANDAGIPGPAVSNCKKIVSAGHATNYTHIGPTGTSSVAVFQFQWTAPDSGNVFIYLACLGVNMNSAPTGDNLKLENLVLTQNIAGIRTYQSEQNSLLILPNPATDKVHLSYTLTGQSNVSIKLTNLSGEVVADLMNENQGRGAQSFDAFLPLGLAKGMYMVKLSINGEQTLQKLMVN